ncbi:MAG: hypothetical protein H6850_03135 [Alphaproteobacteria bacterium]|nr:MAG: hypothetical protein H6850_03135 [Alphaproteobacteria bacterium]
MIDKLNRGFIFIKGAETLDFLQGLLTCDIRKVSTSSRGAEQRGDPATGWPRFSDENLAMTGSSALYGFLLTPNGRFLSDVFITSYKDGYLLEVYDKQNFLTVLNRYKLNRNVEIEDVEGYVGWSLPRHPESKTKDLPESIARRSFALCTQDDEVYYKDPRFYGYRFLSNTPMENFEEYHYHRIKSGISDPPWELIPLKSIILEHNIPEDAVSYNKGCYIGQELIARTHHQGVVRKKITVCNIEDASQQEGTIYSVSQNLCLVMKRQA